MEMEDDSAFQSSYFPPQKIRVISYFIKEIYRTYCVLYSDRINPNNVLPEDNPELRQLRQLRQSVREPLETILTAMKTNLKADKANIAIFYQRIKWIYDTAMSWGINLYPAIAWLADILGYNLVANKEQLAHSGELETYFKKLEMINPAELKWLKDKIQPAIETSKFELHWWQSNHYHHQLILLKQQLSASEELILPTQVRIPSGNPGREFGIFSQSRQASSAVLEDSLTSGFLSTTPPRSILGA